MSETMRIARIHSDSEGQSHFEDVDVGLQSVGYAPPAPAVNLSRPFDASGTVLCSFPAGWYGDWHPTPRRQLYFHLTGRLEVGVADGETRRLESGDIVLVEDVAGSGHTTRVVGDGPATGAFVHLPDEEDGP
jgi:quercetin dioxygenase-like cupin family protein